jgi:hypothetical protein
MTSNTITSETFEDPGYPFPAFSLTIPLTSIPAEYITETELTAALALIANN